MVRNLLPVLVVFAIILVACSPSAAPPAGGAASAQSQALFALNCGECHGDDAKGSDEAPALAGHTVEQVNEQVRNPEGDMEAIPASKLSDADLAVISDFVAGLGGEDAHPDITPTEEEQVHLEAAYQAIEDFENMDRESAITHLEQASALASGEASKLYDELAADIKANKAGNARHELKEMLGMVEEHG